jgi:hypothetical protein
MTRATSLGSRGRKTGSSLALALFPLLFVAGAASAVDATLEWELPTLNVDGSALTNLAGCRVYWGHAGRDYVFSTNLVGAVTNCTIFGLTAGAVYHFAATAYTTAELESDYSEELLWTAVYRAESDYRWMPSREAAWADTIVTNVVSHGQGHRIEYTYIRGLDFAFSVSGGAYVVWAKIVNPANGATGECLYVAMDGTDEDRWDRVVTPTQGAAVWTWDRITGRGQDTSGGSRDPRVFDLSPGAHTLRLSGWEEQVKIEAILVTSDRVFDPSRPDADADGLPDAWETSYFRTLAAGGADDDADGDGASNRHEYLAGTDPGDPASTPALRIAVSNDRVLVTVGPRAADGRIPGIGKRRCVLQACGDAWGGAWTDVRTLPGVSYGSTPAPTIVDLGVPVGGRAFYRSRMWIEP